MKKIMYLALCFFCACSKDAGDAPFVTSPCFYMIDFNNFIPDSNNGADCSNWELATNITEPWRLINETVLTIPEAAIIGAQNAYGKEKNNKYYWNKDITVSDEKYKIGLVSWKIESRCYTFELNICKEGIGGFPEFKWMAGTLYANQTSGQWMFLEGPFNQTPIVQIDWQYTFDVPFGTSKYTYLKEGNRKGSYIEYGINPAPGFDYYYNIHYYNDTINTFSDVEIEWKETNDGRIKIDGEWKYWDNNKQNINCN